MLGTRSYFLNGLSRFERLVNWALKRHPELKIWLLNGLQPGRLYGQVKVGSVLAPRSVVKRSIATSSFLLLVVSPGAPSSVLAPSSDALCS